MILIITFLSFFAVVCFILSFMHYTHKTNALLGLYNSIEFKSVEHRNKFCIIEFRHYFICGVLFLITAVMFYLRVDSYVNTFTSMIILIKMAVHELKLKQLEYTKVT